jgi:predicted porin
MKAAKLVAALMLMAGVAQAQNVTLYGVVGSGVVSGSGFTSANSNFTGLGDQLHNSNRLGVKGVEDLGNGMTAKFTLESNIGLRTGAMGKDAGGTGTNGTVIFDREANVAIAGDFGQIQLGRGKNFLYQVADEFDSRSNWNFGGLKPVARYAGFYSGSGVSRFDNMVRYTSPEIVKGLKFDGAYAFGNQVGDTESKSSYNVGVRYTVGAFDVAYTREEVRLTNAVVSEQIDLIAAKYNVTDALTLNLGYAITDNPSSLREYRASSTKADGKTDARTWFAGAKYKVNNNVSLNAGYYNVQDKVTAGKDDVKMYAVGAVYAFSKRTEVFADYVVANRGANAAAPFTVYDRWVPDAGGSNFADSAFSQRAVAVGIQHRF